MLRSSLFIVRVWRKESREGATRFRASVRAVNAERGRVFTRPGDLARYLFGHCAEELPQQRSSIAANDSTP